ncbi:response regulator transcription factor [Variovorax sp. J22P168]|uniref:response regulator transcription factor n=1 Tax=Variovorax jilinensis TaxID=3053513 RepID=UPI002578CAA7|nr:response regulator transcription factor [Variovorax sp. J22P168]MDM0012240.1 response regulator transcription factor [Variovorax sp. J22P168]
MLAPEQTTTQTTRVIIADDHPIIVAGVRMLLDGQVGIEVVGEADSPDNLLATLRVTPCDLLVTDFSMPGGAAADGLTLLQRIRRDHPALPIIVLTMIGNAGVHGAAIEAGVLGLVDKSSGMSEILLGILAVSQGREYLSPSFRQGLLQSRFDADAGEAARLSPREYEVLRLFATGLTMTAIAARLSRSIKTVSRQKADAMQKLGLRSDLDIFVYARAQALNS